MVFPLSALSSDLNLLPFLKLFKSEIYHLQRLQLKPKVVFECSRKSPKHSKYKGKMSLVKILFYSATLDIIIIWEPVLSAFSLVCFLLFFFAKRNWSKTDGWLLKAIGRLFAFSRPTPPFPKKKVATPFVFFKLQAFFFGILRENECSNVSFPSLRGSGVKE